MSVATLVSRESPALLPIERNTLPLVEMWLSQEENYKWLDFSPLVQPLNAMVLKMMAQKPQHFIQVFRVDTSPAGIVALSNINQSAGTATLWYLLGNKQYAGQGYTTRAVSRLLRTAFFDLKLACLEAWAAESNTASIAILKRNGFVYVGTRRQCHVIDGRRHDRLWFDLLSSEYKEIA